MWVGIICPEAFSGKRKATTLFSLASRKLLNNAAACESELNELEMIFSTEDALTGLSSIGKKVQYVGK